MINRTWAWSPGPYTAALPPPLCFTVPAGKGGARNGPLVTSGGLKVSMRQPKLMMDPSDQSTWQRPYRWTG
jgi:hypothetical protein